MRSITIRNVGPIKEVVLQLNKVNVIMGQQSSGKSTIAKIISQCLWMEKSMNISSDNNPMNFVEDLIQYHRLSAEYFNDNSFIEYKGEYIQLTYNKDSDKHVSVILSSEKTLNSKIIYIPSERNFVSIIPNLGSYAEEDGGILDFIKNWYEAKRKYAKANSLKILDLGVSYYNIENNDYNHLALTDGKELMLQNASSGLQSVVPLVTLFDYVARAVFDEARPMSINEGDKLLKQLKSMIEENKNSVDLKKINQLLHLIESKNYFSSQLIIEEPEQNLYPQTQRNLIEYMLSTFNESAHKNTLLLTTHSPYILYAINNCMLGYLVKDTMPTDRQARIQGQTAWFNPQEVSIWEIDGGHITCIQDDKGLLSKNHFNDIMKQVMNDFDSMLNYYDNED